MALLICRLKQSIARMRSSGERERPCLKPLVAGKKKEGYPLIRIEKLTFLTQAMIQFE